MSEVFVLDRPERLRALRDYLHATWLGAIKRGAALVVTVEAEHKQRTIDQNRRMWALLREIADGAELDGRRFSSDVWHEFFKRQFLPLEEIVLPDGEIITRPMSTTAMDKKQFAEHMERIESYAATELGLEIFA